MLKKTNFASLLIVLLALIANGAQYGLSGTVTSFYFNAPVESCFVILHPESPTAKADSMYTDRLGQYSFPNIWPGVYTVWAVHRDFIADSLYMVVDGVVTGDCELMKKTNFYLSDLPDTLKKAGSPYIIGDTMSIAHSLFIEPGAEIILLQDLTINGPQFMALGASSDLITFTSQSGNVGLYVNSPAQHYKYCTFFKMGFLNFSQQDTINKTRVLIDSCSFSGLSDIGPNYGPLGIGLMEMHNTIIRGYQFGGYADTIKLFQNIFFGADFNGFGANFKYSHAVIKNNDFLGGLTINPYNSRDTIMNNIFTKDVWLSGTNLYFAYNDVVSLQQGVPGVGNPVIQNDNGYLCDLFLNIYYADPLIADILTGALQNGSPCIRAGLNGTNIGVWQGNLTGMASRPAKAGILSLDMKPKTISLLQSGKNFEFGSNLSNAKGPVNLYSLNGRRLAIINNNSLQNSSMVKRLSSGMFVAKMSGSAHAAR